MDLRKGTIEKFLMAGEVYDAMDKEEKQIMMRYAKQVTSIQREISEAACKINAPYYCSECHGGCCTNGIEFGNDIPDYLYAMFYISLEERKKIIDVINAPHDDVDCSLKGESGCALPIITRPIHCKLFYCNVIPESKILMNTFGDSLKEADLQFRCALDEMNLMFLN
ncbi:hypothetical protein GF369_02930 [Candidatus Peregrinibacteria bacterium]|nr:hypothetical protein [Candidatus Peregrinibacteria bacterium]